MRHPDQRAKPLLQIWSQWVENWTVLTITVGVAVETGAIACDRRVAIGQHVLEKLTSGRLRHCATTLIPRMSLFACLAFLHGSGGAYGGDGIMNPRRFAIVAPTFCGTVVLAGGSLAGWLASVRPAPRTPAQCQSRTAQHLSPPPPGSRMNRRQSQWATPLSLTPLSRTPLSLAPKWRRPPNPRRGRPPTRRRPRISRNRSSSALPDPSQTLSADLPPVQKSVDLGHRDVAQPAPTTCGASGGSSNSGPQDFRYLICYVWSELPPAEKPAAIVLRSFKDIPVGTPVEEIKRASDAFGLDFTFMKAVAKVEFRFRPQATHRVVYRAVPAEQIRVRQIRLRRHSQSPR